MNRILVVDDEHLTADTLSIIFRKNGFDARTAYSSDEAIACARDFKPELMLCDITMPGKDGLELITNMSREHPSCRVLVLTGYHSNLNPIREQAKTLPRAPYILTKPCSPVDVLRQAGVLLATA